MLFRSILNVFRSMVAVAFRNAVSTAVSDGIAAGLNDGLARSIGDDYKPPAELKEAVLAAVLRVPALGNPEETAARVLADEPEVLIPKKKRK